MTLVSKFKSFFALEDEVEYREEIMEEDMEDKRPAKGFKQPNQNVVSLQSVQKPNSKVILAEPRAYSEAQTVADELKNRRAVVVNLQKIDHDQAKRIVDFLSGTVYALGGDIQRIGTNIFLCTPDNVDVSGTITGFTQEQEYDEARW
ncbi:cell division inhibitor SepF [Peribacillus deserti]|uniref:Cell division protein SepF n=1 Tax=Peribacillus deserti TaxID=673318 RepID=A0ABS2QGR8_9BACI|nr:cell division protein SepF [Peribacillus deserti]MBM7692347.1 cell division inhibitor SepF [Peribacillus deserti]